MSNTADTAVTGQPPVPATWKDYLRGIGPGIVVAMSWLGTGDLIDSSVAGANYGYALMWAMALALVSKYFYASALAKYQLCNRFDDQSILAGFRRLWRWYPILLGFGALLIGFILQSYVGRGMGTALFHLSGGIGGDQWGVLIWTAVSIALTILIAVSKSKQYQILEFIARVTAVVLIATFMSSAIISGINMVGIVEGLAFTLPADEGVFSSLLVAVALVGAVGSSIGTLLYAEFVRDKGWRGPRYLKLQRLDLAVGLGITLIVNLAIWTVGAETLFGSGKTIENEQDLTEMMNSAVGSFGPILLWVAVFFLTFSSFPAYGRGYAKLLVDGIHQSFPERASKFDHDPVRDPIFSWVQYGLLYTVPLLFALPQFSNLVAFTVAGSSMAAVLAPFVIGGIIVLTSRRKYMQDGTANRPWETLTLVLVGLFALWTSYGVISGLIGHLLGS